MLGLLSVVEGTSLAIGLVDGASVGGGSVVAGGGGGATVVVVVATSTGAVCVSVTVVSTLLNARSVLTYDQVSIESSHTGLGTYCGRACVGFRYERPIVRVAVTGA